MTGTDRPVRSRPECVRSSEHRLDLLGDVALRMLSHPPNQRRSWMRDDARVEATARRVPDRASRLRMHRGGSMHRVRTCNLRVNRTTSDRSPARSPEPHCSHRGRDPRAARPPRTRSPSMLANRGASSLKGARPRLRRSHPIGRVASLAKPSACEPRWRHDRVELRRMATRVADGVSRARRRARSRDLSG